MQILKFIQLAYRRLLYLLLPFLLKIAVKLRAPRLAALILWGTIQPVKTSARPVSAGTPQDHVLILQKAIFEDDMQAVFGNTPEFRLSEISRKNIKIIAHAFLPPHLTDDMRYRSQTSADDVCRDAYRQFLIRMWSALRRFMRCDAVLTGNFSYHAEQELARALEAIGIPFIALHKESLRPPYIATLYAEQYRTQRTPFGGRKILVFNPMERQAQIEGGIIPADRILITGSPRFDALHALRRTRAMQPVEPHKPTVLFFFFTKAPLVFLETTAHRDLYERLRWNRLLPETFHAMLRLARQHPDVRVIIKTKSEKLHTGVLHDLSQEAGDCPTNVEIIAKGNPVELIWQSDVVCGFNTTAVLDALALDRPAVVPRFAEVLEPEFQQCIVDYEDAVTYADSPADLLRILYEQACAHRPARQDLPAAAVRVLDRWMGNGDGKAAERVRQAVLAEIVQSVST